MSVLEDGTGKVIVASGAALIGGAPLTITTSSLPNATVGSQYSATLSATGGVPPYSWNWVTLAPNQGMWASVQFVGGNWVVTGTPQYNEVDTFTLQVNDAVGSSARATFTFTCAATGALAVVTSSLPNATNNGFYSALLIAQGGTPPYVWTIGTVTGATTINQQPSGEMTALPTATGANTFTVTVTDVLFATATASLSVTVDSVLRLMWVDSVDGLIRLPSTNASTKFGGTPGARFAAYGGTAPYTFSVQAGSTGGPTLGSTGTFGGTMGSAAGTNTWTLKVTDNASNTATATVLQNIKSKDQVTRPGYNTGSGFFVHSDGTLRDPNGYKTQFRAMNRDTNNVNQASGWSLLAASGCRYCMHTLNASGTFGGTFYVTEMNRDQTTNYELTDVAAFVTPSYAANPNVTISGDTSSADLSYIVQWYCAQIGNFSAGFQNSMLLNVANEWGPHTWNNVGSYDVNWYNAYLGVIANVTSVSGTTITVSTVSGSNPYANSPFAWIAGVPGVTDQMMLISGTGGSSGAWTVTASASVGTSSGAGGKLGGGAIGALRAAGWLCPIVIDATAFGDDIGGVIAGAPGLSASDPQANCIFTWHAYNYGTPFQAPVSSVGTGATTVLHISSNNTTHPFRNPNVATGFFPEVAVVVSGAAGTGWAAMNGTYTVISSNFTGGTGNWTVTIPFNSTGLTAGNYTANSATVFDWSNPVITCANMQATGLCFFIEEFWCYNPTGATTPSSLAHTDVIQSCEAYGVGYGYWAFDTPFASGSGGMTNPQGTFSGLSNLTTNGLAVYAHTRMSPAVLHSAAPFLLP